MNSPGDNSGCYQLIIELGEDSRLSVGALGEVLLKRGFYVYTGRAKKNLRQRIARHRLKSKKLHWHIDYLLVKGEIIDVLIYPGELDECGLNKNLYNKLEGAIWIKRFGSSDCNCAGHLIHCTDLAKL